MSEDLLDEERILSEEEHERALYLARVVFANVKQLAASHRARAIRRATEQARFTRARVAKIMGLTSGRIQQILDEDK